MNFTNEYYNVDYLHEFAKIYTMIDIELVE